MVNDKPLSKEASDVARVVSMSANIMLALREEYPHVVDLFHYNTKGTIALLAMDGAIRLAELETALEVDHGGTNNIKAWKDYRTVIDLHLEKISDVAYLEPARQSVAEEIHKQHFAAYPFWPALGREQEAQIVLNMTATYDYKRHGYNVAVAWYCKGQLTVGDKRPDGKYLAYVKGSPEFKMLSLKLDKIRELEGVAKANQDEFRKMVDQAAEICQLDTITRLRQLLQNAEINPPTPAA